MRSFLLICIFSVLFSQYSCILSRDQPTKPPYYSQIPRGRVLASNPSNVAHKASQLNHVGTPLIVHPGKHSYVSSTVATPTTTESSANQVKSAKQIQIDHPTHLNGYETQGCIEAVESPSLQRLVVSSTPAPVRTTTPGTPRWVPKARTQIRFSTTTRRPTRLTCPQPNGLFPYGGDCKKFINCWQGRVHVQDCAPGTLFNSAKMFCDHARNVKCQETVPQVVKPTTEKYAEYPTPRFPDQLRGNQQSSQQEIKQLPLAPDSGQRIRLRGGAGPWEGYLEVRGGKNQSWGHVCDSFDEWTIQEATIICQHLGFSRGAHKSIQGLDFGPLTLDVAVVEKVECSGTEKDITGCQIHVGSKCSLHQQVVGVRCHRDTQSLCAADEHIHGNSCYKLASSRMETREQAKTLCENNGGPLLQIFTQSENDFINELLNSIAPSVTKVHTDGIAIRALTKTLFLWEHTERSFNYTKWWPGWESASENVEPRVGAHAMCVVLRNNFQHHSKCTSLPYYYWSLESCDSKAAVICKTKAREIGCVNGNGVDYEGTVNISQTGTPCMRWNDPSIRHVLASLSRSAVASMEPVKDASHLGPAHNYCRNPHGEAHPWCFTSPMEMEYCDIPTCSNSGRKTSSLSSSSKEKRANTCKSNQFQCKSSECIPSTWVCDGTKDCTSGSDESHCLYYLKEFSTMDDMRLMGHDVEKWMNTNLETCARRCAEAKDFQCRSFNFDRKKEECVLSNSNRGLSGGVAAARGSSYYERKEYSVNCTGRFECSNGKCLNASVVCDGRNDCGDDSDEVCRSQLDFQIRLAGSNVTNEGRVEVKVYGVWGAVCDDEFGMNDANVICRQLGFELGASHALSNSPFGAGHPILMDDISCLGNETLLTECSFAGWGVHNCNPGETAGVRCIVTGTTCTENQWRCEDSGACIDMGFLCDRVPDCDDYSDENRTLCDSTLEVRLADGPDQYSGRVEIRRNSVWGTICDDDFGPTDATVLCRMMGLEGPSEVINKNMFGKGQGPIWLDEIGCHGMENSLLECALQPWAKHNCNHTEDVAIACTPPKSDNRKPDGAVPESALTASVLPLSCGRRFIDDNASDPLEHAMAKIVNGDPVKPGAYPWQVGLRVRSRNARDSVHWCGASIISEYFILSAAHCLEDFPKGLYVLRVGDYNTETDDPEEEEFTIERLFLHETFGSEVHLNNDIALIRVKAKNGRGIRFGSYVQPLCIPPATVKYIPGTNCSISGWGSSGQPGSAYAIKLQSATVPLLADDMCKAPHVYGADRIKSGMFCAGYLEGGVDACQGDSGGGLVCLTDGRPTLMGITSWGFGCGRPNRPGVYTKLVHYLPWIHSKLSENS